MSSSVANVTTISRREMLDPIAAWRSFAGDEGEIVAVEALKRRSRTQVYRLVRGEARGRLIAKRCHERVAELERLAAEEVLPRTSLRFARLLGFCREPTGDDGQSYCWVFLEDLGSRRHDVFDATQRTSLARWLGVLGAATPRLPEQTLARLPSRLLASHRPFVDEAASGLSRIAASRPLPVTVARSMHETVRTLHCAGRRWPEFEALVRAVPTVFVHGDCQPKNLHVVDGAPAQVVALDWGSTGLGLPGLDLGLSTVCFARECEVVPSAAAYAQTIRPAWLEADEPSVMRLVHLGRVLHGIKLLAFSLPIFEHHSTRKVDTYLRLYRQLLERSLESLGRALRRSAFSRDKVPDNV